MKSNKAEGILLVLLFAFSFGAFINVGKGATSAAYSPAMIGELGEASTVLIYSQIDATIKIYLPDANWLPTTQYILVPVSAGAMGSGAFVSSDGYIVTAGHVIFSFTHTDIAQDLYTKYFLINASFAVLLQGLEDAGYSFTIPEQVQLLAYIQQYGALQDSLRQVYAILGEVKTTLTDIQSKGWVARVVSVSPYIERDLALLKVEGLSNCPVLVVGNSDNVMTGDNVYMFGFPGVVTFHVDLGPETTLAPSMTSGIISAKRLTNVQTPCFQTDAMITHGNSGGPGLNNNAQIIGICSRGSISEAGQEVAGFDFLIQSNVLKTFLTESSVNNIKGPVDDAFIKGLTYYYDKHYSAAKAEFETAAGLFAYHWRATALITECASAIARGQDVPLGMSTWTMVAIVGAVMSAAIVTVAIMIIARRKRTLSVPPPPA